MQETQKAGEFVLLQGQKVRETHVLGWETQTPRKAGSFRTAAHEATILLMQRA